MGLIAAQYDLTGTISKAAEKVKLLLAQKGIKPDDERMLEDRRWLLKFGNENYNIKFWSLATNTPKDGELVATINYFTLYKTKRIPPNSLGADAKVIVLQLVPNIPRKKRS